jgi:hypothetical protein
MSIGSTYAPHSTLLTVTSDDSWSDDQSDESEESEEDQWDDMEDVIDSTMAFATARFASGVNPKHLSKIWRISHEDAERTIDNTTHLGLRRRSGSLSSVVERVCFARTGSDSPAHFCEPGGFAGNETSARC